MLVVKRAHACRRQCWVRLLRFPHRLTDVDGCRRSVGKAVVHRHHLYGTKVLAGTIVTGVFDTNKHVPHAVNVSPTSKDHIAAHRFLVGKKLVVVVARDRLRIARTEGLQSSSSGQRRSVSCRSRGGRGGVYGSTDAAAAVQDGIEEDTAGKKEQKTEGTEDDADNSASRQTTPHCGAADCVCVGVKVKQRKQSSDDEHLRAVEVQQQQFKKKKKKKREVNNCCVHYLSASTSVAAKNYVTHV